MKTATAAAKAFGLPEDKAYDSAEAIANDPDVDMVTVSVKVSRRAGEWSKPLQNAC